MALVRAEQSSPSASRSIMYDVFLSLGGEDTRKTFIDHLYKALVQAELRTFKNNGIKRGERLELELLKAAQESRISIIVLSKNYAFSRWCLDELVSILEWSRSSSGGHKVLPVFYDVHPSDVRKSFGEAFAIYEAELIESETDPELKQKWMEKVQGWREALVEAANLAGMVLHNQAHSYEVRFIQELVRAIEDKLKVKLLHVPDYFIGRSAVIQEIENKLKIHKFQVTSEAGVQVGLLSLEGEAPSSKETVESQSLLFLQHISDFDLH